MKRKLALIFISTFCFILMASCLVACNVVITSADFKTTNHTVDPFSSIEIDVDVSEIELVKATDKKYAVSCYETDEYYHKVSVENGVLKIKSTSTFSFNFNIGWAKAPEITIYLSEDVYDSLKVSANTGSVSIDKGLTFGSVDIDTDTGAVDCSADITNTVDINTDTGAIRIDGITNASAINLDTATAGVEMKNVNCSNLRINSDTGAVDLKNVISKTLFIDVSTGAVNLSQCNGSESIIISTDTGSVTATLLTSDRYFDIDCDMGLVNVPASTEGGALVKVSVDMGSVNISYCN
ncbi:MAG: DUF4097 family beta strand repeat protein [Clostridia bacterium]|nr:DUF4097 family beta strand repeat protein [Clostridia bacterium]